MTTTTTTSRHETVTRFLAALAGSAEGGELLELRYRLETGSAWARSLTAPPGCAV